jgi:hypothetical protein
LQSAFGPGIIEYDEMALFMACMSEVQRVA